VSILVNEATRVIVVGIADPEVRAITERMVVYGTGVVAGVAPAGAGTAGDSIPVYRTIAEAAVHHPANTAMISVPPPTVLDVCLEALGHGIRLLLIATGDLPSRNTPLILERARDAMARVIGPGTDGMISPAGRIRLGAIGGGDPDQVFRPGRIGIIAGSGRHAEGIGRATANLGLGVSTAVSVGHGAPVGTTPAQLLPLFQRDAETDGVVLRLEPGAGYEEDIAEMVRSRRYTKPLLVFTGPRLPAAQGPSNHAAVGDGTGEPGIETLRELGALVTDDPRDLRQFLSLVFLKRPYLGELGGDLDDD
jgi:succinyl-CoA synthetase alpha subunit